jgi:hypothetical protein
MNAQAKLGRALYLGVLPLALGALAVFQPASFSHRLLFPTSCGAISGLPCIFCGTTRAMHFLLQGDFGRALYYNWLAFPILAAALVLHLLFVAELGLNRNLLARLPRPHFKPRSLGLLLPGLVLLWLFQVYLAVSQHKTELLNPRGPLYSLIVR